VDAADRFAVEPTVDGDGDGLGHEDGRIAALEAEAILRDGRIAELVREVDGLRAAMEHRSVIEQAKGVLMHSMRCSPDAAFAVLVAASQRENVKLRDIALRIAAAQVEDEPAAAQD
jgi:AmiR/NasT family two-component response regulator